MNENRSMAGWIGFASMLLLLIGVIDFFQGLVAVFEDDYYVVTRAGFLALDLTQWGWAMMLWGVLLALVGIGLAAAQSWARWSAIVLVSLNVLAQLGFHGNSQYPLWALTVLTLSIVVLYALTVRWDDSRADLIQR